MAQLRIDIAHLVDDDAHHFHQCRLPATEQPRVAHRAAEDAAQDVTAALVRWKDSAAEEEGYRSTVIRDDAERRAPFPTIVLLFDGLFDGLDERLEKIGVEIVRFPLHDRGDALQSRDHAGGI